jgi:hypothetical protein
MKKLIQIAAFTFIAALALNTSYAQNAHVEAYSLSGSTLTIKLAGLGNSTWCTTLTASMDASIDCIKDVNGAGNNGDGTTTITKHSDVVFGPFNAFVTAKNGTQTVSYQVNATEVTPTCPADPSGFVPVPGTLHTGLLTVTGAFVKGGCL